MPLHLFHLDPTSILDSGQFSERPPPRVRIRILDQHRRLPVLAIRNQWVIGVEFALNTGTFEDAFDAQHFQDLVAKRDAILEAPCHVRSDLYVAYQLMRDDFAAQTLAID